MDKNTLRVIKIIAVVLWMILLILALWGGLFNGLNPYKGLVTVILIWFAVWIIPWAIDRFLS
jgi:hypothetical protein